MVGEARGERGDMVGEGREGREAWKVKGGVSLVMTYCDHNGRVPTPSATLNLSIL